MMIKSKRGQEGLSSSGTVAAIIIIAVLIIFVILYVSGAIPDFLGIFGGGKSLSAAGKTCLIACSSADSPGFCVQGIDVKGLKGLTAAQMNVLGATDANPAKVTVTCAKLAEAGLIAACTSAEINCAGLIGPVVPPVTGTCSGIAKACSSFPKTCMNSKNVVQAGCTPTDNGCASTTAGVKQCPAITTDKTACENQEPCTWTAS